MRKLRPVIEPSLSSAESGYLFDNRASEAGQRFDSLSALFNPVTFRHLDALGIDGLVAKTHAGPGLIGGWATR